jgi:hypothetical protein
MTRPVEARHAFCACLARGLKPGEAARAVGITRKTAYAWRASDPAFREMWDTARDELGDEAESQLFQAVRTGNIAAIMFACRHWRPEIYDRARRVAIGGDRDAPPINTVHFFMPSNGRDRPEELEGEIDGEADEDAA